jgi:drug/metabolite transporter (DMT)-like permease
MSLAPIFGSVIAWVFFGETLSPLQITGILLALSGIGWVVMSHEEPPNTPRGHTKRGVFFGVLAALGQAVGLVLSKQGMFGEFSPFQANVIRMLAAVVFIWMWTLLQGEAGATLTALRAKPQVIRLLALGALVGPVLGVSSSLLAVQHTQVGVASTLMTLPPVIILPISYFVLREKIGWQAGRSLPGRLKFLLAQIEGPVAVLFLAYGNVIFQIL